MNIRKLGVAAAAVLLCGIAVTYLLFEQGQTTAAATVPEKKTVRVLSCYEIKRERDFLKGLAKEFNSKEADFQVEIEFIDKENLKKDIGLRVDGGTQPDIVICDSMEMPALADMGVLADVTDWVQEEFSYSLIYQDMWQSSMNHGAYYGIPFTCNPYVLFGNTEYLKRLKTEMPENWEEFFALCRAGGLSGIYDLEMGVKRSQDGAAVFNALLHVCGASYYNLSGEYGLRALEIFDTLKYWGYVDKKAVNSTQKDVAGRFGGGQSVFLIAPLDTRMWLEDERPEFSCRISALPMEIKEGYVLSGDNLGLLKGSGDEAREFVKFLYKTENRLQLLEATGTLPLFQEEYRKYQASGDIAALNDAFFYKGETLKSYNSWFEISEVLKDNLYTLLTKRNLELPEQAKALQDEIRVAVMNN